MPNVILSHLQQFATTATTKLKAETGEPEEQLRAPLETFFQDAGKELGMKVQALGEVHVDNMGRPDFAVTCNGALCGYIELKAPGKGGDPRRYRNKHDKAQWERFQNFPNILYTDGNEWSLFQGSVEDGRVRRLSGSVETDGAKAVVEDDAAGLEGLLREFLTWDPIVPKNASQLAEMLAPLCRLLRDEVERAMSNPASPFVHLAKDWRGTLFSGTDDKEAATFADAYAQTVTFALLLAREGHADVLDLGKAVSSLKTEHALLSKTLQLLTSELSSSETPAAIGVLQRVIAQVSPEGWSDKGRDPWLYFYEHFLARYDPALRKDAGVYYTPVDVVQAQVRLVDQLLTTKLDMKEGFASEHVFTLDPAVGTGTYLIGIIRHALERVAVKQGPGAVEGVANRLARQLYGFEMLVGPYAVAQLRLERILLDNEATIPDGGPCVFLTDTLESPTTVSEWPSFLLRELSLQHERALEIKSKRPILICIGNPPYDRHSTASEGNRKETGGWVRWGDDNENGQFVPQKAILEDFLRPVRDAGDGEHLKNLYNYYVYFWRWALWKVFESDTAGGPGVVSFITPSSFLDGPAFTGMRESMRRLCDEVWVIDLGGEGRGTRKDDNVFNILVPVAITVAVRYGQPQSDIPASVKYCCLEGTREDKLWQLNRVLGFNSFSWTACPNEWSAPMKPAGVGRFFSWPKLTDIMPWQHSGAQFKRTWPIATDRDVLVARWRDLLTASDKAKVFKESRDRKVDREKRDFLSHRVLPALNALRPDTECPAIVSYGFRSFDRHFCIADNRLGDFLRPPLWSSFSQKQLYFSTLSTQPLDTGPGLTVGADIPDLHYFRGSYGSADIIPLYRDAEASFPNIVPGLLPLLERVFGEVVSAEEFVAYLYGLMACPYYTERFYSELGSKELRVPLTKSVELFRRVAALGRKLIWLHSFARRLVPAKEEQGVIPTGKARCMKAVSEASASYPAEFSYDGETLELRVGSGVFSPVSQALMNIEVSGFKVVESWLSVRMKSGAGKKSSLLDKIRPERWTAAYTTDLLNLLWVLEATLETYPAQEAAIDAVLDGPMFLAEELPEVPEEARKAPEESDERKKEQKQVKFVLPTGNAPGKG